ncbi:cytochrome c [Algoriphagus sp. D3-2-R+10]|uniref:c-type cytochrome n=1 Tax=Algoriphagus aurantiacus TaxID=3103948 RepID=UPI002B37B570|nr:cytochrome c [Algoriphagus sp. D3-2-R+10]MEB2774479.1 cytochrome c [Algoriphagus sp. D3-2-R+10]
MRRNLIFILFTLAACTQKTSEENVDSSVEKEQAYIRAIEGEDEEIAMYIIKKGEVLISYSDCAECHKSDKRAKGPAFQDIAKRYPIKQVYIDLLARKVISGGSGSWGSPVMSPHPNLKEEDAKAMVSYILSLKE